MKAPPEAHPPLPAALAALTGQGVAAIDTPAAVIDLDAMERNLARMAAFARTHGVRLGLNIMGIIYLEVIVWDLKQKLMENLFQEQNLGLA